MSLVNRGFSGFCGPIVGCTSGGRIRLSFADGSVSVRTIGIGIGKNGRPDAAGEGLLLDDVNFYVDDA